MNGYADSVDLYTQSLDSAGTTQAKYNLWLEGTEAKVQGAKVAMESFWLNFYDSKTMNGIIEGFTGLVNILDAVSSKVGGISAVAPLIGMMSTFTKFSPTKIFENIDSETGKATKGIKLFGVELGTLGKDLKTVQSAKMQFVEATKAGTTAEINGTVATSKANAMRLALGQTTTGLIAKQIALNAVVSLGVGLLVTGLAVGLSKVANGAKDAQREMEQMMATLPQKNKESLNEGNLVNRFNELSKATSLNKEEGQELLELQKKLAEIFPQTANSIDAEGNMLTTNTQQVNELYQAKLDLLRLENESVAMKAKDELPALESKIEKGKAELDRVNKLIANKEYFGGDGKKNSYDSDGKAYETKLKLEKIQAKETKSLKEATEQVITYKNALNVIDVVTKNDIKNSANKNAKYKENKIVTNELIQSLKEQGFAENDIVGALQKTGNALDNKGQKIQDATDANDNMVYSEEKSQEAYRKSQEEIIRTSNNIQFYTGVINELNSGNGVTADTVRKITSEYPELLSFLDDEIGLRDVINHKIDEESDIQKEAYKIMMQNDETYYSKKIKYNVDVQNAVNKLAQDFVGSFAGSYGVDLRNFKNLAEAKSAILARMNAQINDMENRLASVSQASDGDAYANGYKIYSAERQLSSLRYNKQTFSQKFDDLTVSFAGYNGIKSSSSGLKGGGGGSSGSGGSGSGGNNSVKEDVADLEILIDRYANLNSVLGDLNYTLDRNKQKQDLATDEQKIRLLEEQISLYGQIKDSHNEMWKEQQKAKLETLDKLWGAGFDIRDGEITNLKAQMESWVSWANSATGDTKKERQEQVQALDQTTKDYYSIYNAITDTNKQWYEQINLIETAKKEIETIKMDKISNEFDKFLESYNSKLTNLDFQKAIDSGMNKNTDWVINEQLKLSEEKIQAISNQMNALTRTKVESEEGQKRLNKLYRDAFESLKAQRIESEALKVNIENIKMDGLSSEFQKLSTTYEATMGTLDLKKAIRENNKGDIDIITSEKLALSEQRIKDIERYMATLSSTTIKSEEGQTRLNELYRDAFNLLRQQRIESEALKAEIENQKMEQLSLIESVESKITDIMKKEAEKQRKIIEDGYNKRIEFANKTKDLLNKENREEDYGKDLSEERRKLEELNRSVNEAMMDTSDMGKLRLRQLQKEFNDQQKKIDDMIKGHERTLNNELLDEEIKNLEEQKKKELESFDKEWSDDRIAQIVKKALFDGFYTDINGNIKTLTSSFLEYMNEFENGTSIAGERIKKEFIDNLEIVKGLMKDIDGLWKGYGLAPTGGSYTLNPLDKGNTEANLSRLTNQIPNMTPLNGVQMDAKKANSNNNMNIGKMVEFNIENISDLSDKAFIEKVDKMGNIIYEVVEKNLKESMYK